MTDRYVRSTDGDNADDGLSWANADLDGAGAAAVDAAGDRIFFSHSHAESTAASISWAWAGSLASPTLLICGNDGAEPPTAVATSGTVTATGSGSGITISSNASHGYCYGLQFFAGTLTGAASILVNNGASANWTFDSCDFNLVGTGNGTIQLAGSANIQTRLVNCDVKFSATGQAMTVAGANSLVVWDGGSVLAGSTSPTTLITTLNAAFLISGVDFSNLGSSVNFCNTTNGGVRFIMRNCKLPASWSGSVNSGTVGQGSRFEMHDCDSGDTNYRIVIKDFLGAIDSETTIVRSGGASDGTTSLAWKMVTNASAEWPFLVLRSPEIVRWNETTGSSITVTVEIVHDSQGSGASSAFTDREVWLEVQYLGTSGFPLGSFVDDAAADVLASAADQTSSSVTWTTTGLTTPVKQKLSVSFTPREKGFIHATVCMAGASDTCYVDPVLTVS